MHDLFFRCLFLFSARHSFLFAGCSTVSKFVLDSRFRFLAPDFVSCVLSLFLFAPLSPAPKTAGFRQHSMREGQRPLFHLGVRWRFGVGVTRPTSKSEIRN